MKIVMITEYFPQSKDCEIRGGVEARCFYVARELAKKHKVTVISALEPNMPREQAFDGIRIIRCGKHQEYRQAGSVKERLSFMKEAYKLGTKLDADLVEGTNFVSYLPAYYIARKKHLPRIALYNDVWIGKWIYNIGLIQGLMGEILERFILSRNWSCLIANSRFTLKNLRNYGLEKDRLKLIYSGVDTKKCRSISVPKEKRPTICCVSRLVEYKKVDILIRAVSSIKNHIENIQCKIIGIGPEFEKLEGLVKKLNLENNVNFLGFIRSHHDVLKTIKKSHIFCLSSIVEGFGLVVIEAMACATPFVCSNIPALKEVTRNGMGGLLFERENPDDLAKRILHLLEDDHLYRKCIHEGLKLAQKYDWSNTATKTEMLYHKMRIESPSPTLIK
ncbi:D-inositol-3-phosphate glycosyltransferase [subsurface metagenome]